jgi:hypothetical protein
MVIFESLLILVLNHRSSIADQQGITNQRLLISIEDCPSSKDFRAGRSEKRKRAVLDWGGQRAGAEGYSSTRCRAPSASASCCRMRLATANVNVAPPTIHAVAGWNQYVTNNSAVRERPIPIRTIACDAPGGH